MNWGAGPPLGPLTFFGYLICTVGAALVWRHRGDFFVYFQDELSVFRRNFSRFIPIGPFYIPREDSRLKAIPTSVIRSVRRLPRSRFNRGPLLLLIGLLLFALDFFV
jgi:hypothetical protein